VKYNDSIAQAKTKMVLAIKQLENWKLPANPINYAISYEYVSGKNKLLREKIILQVKSTQTLDAFFMEEIYQQFISKQSSFRDCLIDDLDNVLSSMNQGCKLSYNSVEGFIVQLDKNVAGLQSTNTEVVSKAASYIKKASIQLQQKQKKIMQSLRASQHQADTLKAELEEVKKEIYLDPLTGLYNRKALDKHLDTWHHDDPNQNIAAVVINVDHFEQLSHKFGPLIGNVLLSKVAKKVSSYVGDSGFPVRTNGNEFLILLPGIEKNIATEIAEKIRQGVEKLSFISSKTGVRLPKMTISLGINQLKPAQNIDNILNKTREIIQNFQLSNRNKVIGT
jgi:diguanylate cyclase